MNKCNEKFIKKHNIDLSSIDTRIYTLRDINPIIHKYEVQGRKYNTNISFRDEVEKQKGKGCDVHYGPISSNYDSPENKNYIPKAGDLVYYDFDNNNALNHVGIVQSADSNEIHTIEGNTSGEQEMSGKGDCVSHKTRSYNDVYAFVTPKK